MKEKDTSKQARSVFPRLFLLVLGLLAAVSGWLIWKSSIAPEKQSHPASVLFSPVPLQANTLMDDLETPPFRAAPGESPDASLPESALEMPMDKMDINRASAYDLQKVPGIGPVLSQAIIDYRRAKGGFHFLEEVLDVPGIGEKRFRALSELFFCQAPFYEK